MALLTHSQRELLSALDSLGNNDTFLSSLSEECVYLATDSTGKQFYLTKERLLKLAAQELRKQYKAQGLE